MPAPADPRLDLAEFLRFEAPMELARLWSVGRLTGTGPDGTAPADLASCPDA